MRNQPITIATWNRTFAGDFGDAHTRPERVAVLNETAQGDATVIVLDESGDWSGYTLTAYPHEIEARRPGVAGPTGRIFELAH